MPVRASVVIPNHNGREVLPTCLDSVYAQRSPADEVIVVDDASPDGSAAWVREAYPEVDLIILTTNRGFCGAANAGLRRARGDIVLLLNNDTVADPDCLRELQGALLSHPEISFCACKMLFNDSRQRINSAGLFLRRDGVGRDIGYGQLDGPAFSVAREVFGASGGAAAYRKSMLEDVGLLDESYVAYAEDLDLSFRAQLRGHRCLYVPTAVVYHRGSATYQRDSDQAAYYGSRNMLAVLLKNMPTRLLIRYSSYLIATQLYQIGYNMTQGHGWAAIRGKLAVLRDLRVIRMKRRVLMASRKVSDTYIDSLLDAGWRESIHFSWFGTRRGNS